MKALRHRLGRWLLRDARPPHIELKIVARDDASAVLRAIARHRRHRGETA